MTKIQLLKVLEKMPDHSEVVIQEPFQVVRHVVDVKATEHGFIVIFMRAKSEPTQQKVF